jgi:WD40 repeat protein
VSGGEDGTVRIWDLADAQPVRQCRGHAGWVYAVALSPDGRTVASAGDDATIRLWRLQTGQTTGVLIGHQRRIRSLAFTPDGLLVSGAEDGQVCLWDTARATLIRAMHAPGTPVWAVATAANRPLIAAAGEDEFVRLYDRDSGDMITEKAGHRDWIRALTFPGDTLITGSGDGSVREWRLTGGELSLLRTIEMGSRVRAVAASPNADLIVVADEQARLRAYSGDGLVGEQQIPGGVDWARSIALRPDRLVIAGCEDGSVRVWDDQGLTILGHGSDTTWSAAFAGDQAVLGRANGVVEFRDLASGELTRSLEAGEGRVWSLAAGSDVAAAACGDGSVRLWSPSNSWALHLNREERRTWSVALTEAGSRVAASSAAGITRVWELPSGRLLWERKTHVGRVRSMAFDASGDLLLTGGGDGSTRLWRLSADDMAGEFLHRTSWIRAVAMDVTGERVAVGCGPGAIYVHSITNGQDVIELHGHSGRVLMVGFTADPDVLISAAADGTIRSWSLAAQKQLAVVRVDASLQAAALDAGKGIVLAASADGTMAIRIPAMRMAE